MRARLGLLGLGQWGARGRGVGEAKKATRARTGNHPPLRKTDFAPNCPPKPTETQMDDEEETG